MPKKKHLQKKVPYLTQRKLVFTIFATIGVVAVWRGVWIFFDNIPYFDNPIVAISVALTILVLAGVYFRKIDFF